MPQILYTVTGIIAEVGNYPSTDIVDPAMVSIATECWGHKRPVETLVSRDTAVAVAKHLYKRVIITVALADDAEDE